MGQGYNKLINGQCLNTPLNNNIKLFKKISVHTVMNTMTGVGYASSVCGCGKNNPSVGFYTETIPDFYLVSTVNRTPVYGQTVAPVILKAKDGTDIYFDSTELLNWGKRARFNPNVYQMFCQGPSYSSTHSWSSLSRKLKYQSNYPNRLNYDFLDSSSPLAPTTSSTTTPEPGPGTTTTPEPSTVPCVLDDWLIYANPADSLYSNVLSPFTADDFYENSGSLPPTSGTLGNQNFMPFCYPMPVRDTDGTQIGEYVGLSFIYKFGRATMSYPVRPYLPENPYSSLPIRPPVNPLNAFYSMEMNAYITNTEADVGSPCIGRIRWWFYSLAPGGSGDQLYDWRIPYFYILCGAMNGQWQTNITFNHVGGGSENILFNLSDLQTLVTA